MKKIWKKVLCLCLVFALCFGIRVPSMAASKKYTAASNSYKAYVKKNKGKYDKTKYKIVDIDKNGIPELVIHNGKREQNEVYTYNYSKRKMVLLKRKDYLRLYNGGVGYSTSKKSFVLSAAGFRVWYYDFYKVSGTTVKKVASFTEEYDRNGRYYYCLNGKKVSKKTYQAKWKSVYKGYKFF